MLTTKVYTYKLTCPDLLSLCPPAEVLQTSELSIEALAAAVPSLAAAIIKQMAAKG
jgi:hypothetical protein